MMPEAAVDASHSSTCCWTTTWGVLFVGGSRVTFCMPPPTWTPLVTTDRRLHAAPGVDVVS